MKLNQMKRISGTVRRKMGPVGLSLVAAALTATAFAGVSVAQDDSGNSAGKKQGSGDVTRAHGPGGPPMLQEQLSDEDRQALEEFRQCMEDNGAPAPPERPEPGSFDEDNPPERPDPPSEEDRAAIEKAAEACEDKLPEGVRGFGPGGHGGPGCGPPPNGTPPSTAPDQGDSGEQQAAPQGSSSGSAS